MPDKSTQTLGNSLLAANGIDCLWSDNGKILDSPRMQLCLFHF